jgi:hypothetical protein
MGLFMAFMFTPWFGQIEAIARGDLLLRVLAAPLALVAPLASLVLLVGMVVFCVREDPSPISAKLLWFILFLATGPFGSAAYFFRVYRKQVQDASA